MSDDIKMINERIAEKRANILAVLNKSGLKNNDSLKSKQSTSVLETSENSQQKVSAISLSLQ
jgi:hypothetical protein